VKRAKGWIVYESFESDGETGGRTVHEAEDAFEAKPTGVLDANGYMIYREPEPVGFRLVKK
jgi:hypothetical protein